jgi:hypothetical protein
MVRRARSSAAAAALISAIVVAAAAIVDRLHGARIAPGSVIAGVPVGGLSKAGR